MRTGNDDELAISAAKVVEASLVLRVRQIDPARAEAWLDEFIHVAGMHLELVTPEQAGFAPDVHIRFGKGTGHPAV
ncbi:MAG: type II toxin-antitoxin system VapC family toxin [Gluconacetobacter sp.]